jgi:low temperature requirement protein LtrA
MQAVEIHQNPVNSHLWPLVCAVVVVMVVMVGAVVVVVDVVVVVVAVVVWEWCINALIPTHLTPQPS